MATPAEPPAKMAKVDKEQAKQVGSWVGGSS
jgi:hypothetical protein